MEKQRMKVKYDQEVVGKLREAFSYKSIMQVPKLQKIVINCGVGDTTQNVKAIEFANYIITQITGQKPSVRKSKKAIANFKLREGLPVGTMATLRGNRMWHFYDRLVALALPRMRDFRGISAKGFDGRGNFTMGINEATIFPEVLNDKLDKNRGMDITFVTSAETDAEGRALLKELGFPFR